MFIYPYIDTPELRVTCMAYICLHVKWSFADEAAPEVDEVPEVPARGKLESAHETKSLTGLLAAAAPLVMCRLRPEARSRAKPGQKKPGQAKPFTWPEVAFGPAGDFRKPKPPAWALAFVGIYESTIFFSKQYVNSNLLLF